MVVEHTFVTTLDAPDAMRAASELLTARGFQVEASNAFALDGSGWNTLEVYRGRKNPVRAKSAVELPQRVRLEWDRGRVTVAASSQSAYNQDSGASLRLVAARNRKQEKDQTDLLMRIALALEQALAAGQPEQAALEWGRLEQSIADRVAAARRRTRNILIGFGVFVLVVIIIGIVGAMFQDR